MTDGKNAAFAQRLSQASRRGCRMVQALVRGELRIRALRPDFRGFDAGGGVMVAPASEVITAILLSVLIFGPTLYWFGWMALTIIRRLLKH